IVRVGRATDPTSTRFSSRSRFVWIPTHRVDVHRSRADLIRSVLCSSTVQLIHLDSDVLLPVGQIQLGGINYNGPSLIEYGFNLANILNRDEWLLLGGYVGWLVEINGEELVNV